jgi:hypothetical protein
VNLITDTIRPIFADSDILIHPEKIIDDSILVIQSEVFDPIYQANQYYFDLDKNLFLTPTPILTP